MKDKINYVEAIMLHLNNTKDLIAKLRFNDGKYGRRGVLVSVGVEATLKQRINRIILSYVLLFVVSVLTILFYFINVLAIIIGLFIITNIFIDLLGTYNFSFVKILIFKSLYNDNSNSYKLLIKELYHEN
jgi:hypothetical protein